MPPRNRGVSPHSPSSVERFPLEQGTAHANNNNLASATTATRQDDDGTKTVPSQDNHEPQNDVPPSAVTEGKEEQQSRVCQHHHHFSGQTTAAAVVAMGNDAGSSHQHPNRSSSVTTNGTAGTTRAQHRRRSSFDDGARGYLRVDSEGGFIVVGDRHPQRRRRQAAVAASASSKTSARTLPSVHTRTGPLNGHHAAGERGERPRRQGGFLLAFSDTLTDIAYRHVWMPWRIFIDRIRTHSSFRVLLSKLLLSLGMGVVIIVKCVMSIAVGLLLLRTFVGALDIVFSLWGSTDTIASPIHQEFYNGIGAPPPEALKHSTKFAVAINTYKRPEVLKDAVRHYSQTCGKASFISKVIVIWADQDTEPPKDVDAFFFPPSPSDTNSGVGVSTSAANGTLTTSLRPQQFTPTIPTAVGSGGADYMHAAALLIQNRASIVIQKTPTSSLNARFLLSTDLDEEEAIFSVDDDARVSCESLRQGFHAWNAFPDSMVGYYPRLAKVTSVTNDADGSSRKLKTVLPTEEGTRTPPPLRQPEHLLPVANPYAGGSDNGDGGLDDNVVVQQDPHRHHEQILYKSWPSIFMTQKFNFVLTKAAFISKSYLYAYWSDDIHPKEIRDYIDEQHNCEDLAMALLVNNMTKTAEGRPGAPPIFVEGHVVDVGLGLGFSSQVGHHWTRSKCLTQLTQIYQRHGWDPPLNFEVPLRDYSWIQHFPGYWWQYRPSNPAEWIGDLFPWL